MLISFKKLAGGRHEIVVEQRQQGPDLRRPPRETGPTMPHDLVHAIVESVLGLDDGFWAAVDRGVMYDDFERLVPQRHRRAGSKRRRRYGETLPAEMMVSWCHRVWSGQRTEGRGLGSPPVSEEQLDVALPALERGWARWREVADGEALVWRWGTGAGERSYSHSGRRRA